VIFVTHDIDEAIKMGDRIAILHAGGVLAQYDTPDEILANPSSEFVERFVGADRGLKRLSLRRMEDVELEPASAVSSDAPRCKRTTTLRDALSLMLTEGAHEAVVVDDDGEPVGTLSLQRVSDLLREQVTA
jgi:osmoprotectant transport system ATP-binding protein